MLSRQCLKPVSAQRSVPQTSHSRASALSKGRLASKSWHRQLSVRAAAASSSEPAIDDGSINNNGGSGSKGYGGGKGDSGSSGDGGSDVPGKNIAALLVAANRTVESLPKDFAQGIAAGKVTTEVLKKFFELESAFFVGWLMKFPGFRERLLADNSFMVKVAIEVGIGLFMKLSAEYTKRQGSFIAEIDFVTANTLMALIADFMLVWLPAPTLTFKPRPVTTNALASLFANCPDNAFQKVQPGMEPFTLGQRGLAVLRNGTKLVGVGFGASMVGVAVTNLLNMLKSQLESGGGQQQDVVGTSLAYGVYMATSSNLRYQIVAGVLEERGIETIFKGKPQLCHALSLTIRTLNTFLGSLLWVDFVRFVGIQPAAH